MNWKSIGDNLSDQIHTAYRKSQNGISPEQAMTNAQLTDTVKAFLDACREHKRATADDILWLQTLYDATNELPITPDDTAGRDPSQKEACA